MKTSLILLITFFITFPLWGSENTCLPLSKLQKGDWFTIRCVQHLLSSRQEAVPSDIENVLSTSFRGEVIEKSARKVQIAFYLKHVYLNWMQYDQSPYITGNTQNYFDSYYYENSLPLEKSVINLEITLNKKNKIICTSDSVYLFSYDIIPWGMKTSTPYTKSSGSMPVDISSLANQVILPFLENQHPSNPEFDCQLTDASFPISPNVFLTYIPGNPLAPDQARLSLGHHDYPLETQNDSSYSVALFLSRPQRGWIGESPVQLMPGDSLTIRQTGNDRFTYEGKGAADCFFYQDLYKLYNFFFNYQSFWQLKTPQEIAERTKKGRAIYDELLSKYGKDMHPYWKISAIRSQQYGEITIHLRAHQMAQNSKSITPAQAEQYNIPWQQAPYSEVTPFTDYLYQPFQFDLFWQAFFQYKAQQLNSDNLTNKFYWANNPETYYLQKQLFSGYPQIYCLAENLKDMMQQQALSGIKREYADFLGLCKNPEITDEIRQLWSLYMKIEPGANIKDSGLDIIPFLPLKKKADGYILLSESYVFGDPQDFTTNPEIEKILTELKIRDKTTLCYFRPDSRRQFLPDSLKGKNIYTFIPDSLINADENKIHTSPWAMIFMRNDGTILTRNIKKTTFGIANLQAELQEAIQLSREERKFTKSEVYGFLLGFLIFFTLTFTFVFIRFKRIRIMRRFTELKLRAIRSQMNPHFIFNAMGSIQALILQGKNETANRYLTDFSKLLRIVLSNSEKQLIPLSDEIDLLRLYLKIEQLRTPFEFVITTDPSVNSDQEEVPGMLLQPLVENAVIHGIVPQGYGKIDILFYRRDNILYAEISDNGPGFRLPKPGTFQQKHFGIRSIDERLKLLNESYHARIGIQVENRPEKNGNKGCRIIISIPV